MLGAGPSSIQSEGRARFAYFHSTAHAVESHRNYFGPTIRAFESVNAETRERLQKDIEDVCRRYNRATDGSAVVEYQYLQTLAIRA